jgi:hypothetical protein
MKPYQGAGFSIELPDDIADASSFVFVRDDQSDSPPTLRITLQPVAEAPADMGSYLRDLLHKECARVPGLELVDTSVNSRDNWLYGIATLAWGQEIYSLRERRIYLFVADERPRHFVLSVTAPGNAFDEANLYFAGAIRSFMPNEVQNFVAQAKPDS